MEERTIAQRLRHMAKLLGIGHFDIPGLLNEAADEIEAILAEHELMRKTLETISGNAGDRLQETQARGAIANIGPRI